MWWECRHQPLLKEINNGSDSVFTLEIKIINLYAVTVMLEILMVKINAIYGTDCMIN